MAVPTIPEFFHQQKVFITGATGFMGKVLIEKLLRSCPNISELYILVRSKRGEAADSRWKKITENLLFNKLREEFPEALNKVIVLSGDTDSLNLGLSEENIEILIKEVTVVFNIAANIRFAEVLSDSFNSNVKGTLEIASLAKQMLRLKCLVHVSTAYSNCDKLYAKEEKLYPAVQDWKNILHAVKTNDPFTLGALSNKILAGHPTVYTLSKSLAEQVLSDYSSFFPVVIMRPSIVINMIEDPIPGWTENLSGPIAVSLVTASGINRINFTDLNTYLDYIPVDCAINGLLVAAWDMGLRDKKNGLEVYNCCSTDYYKISGHDIQQIGKDLYEEDPLEEMIWTPSHFVTESLLLFQLLSIFLHVIPALLMDCFLWSIGRKPRVLNIIKKIRVAHEIFKHFMMRTYEFSSDRYMNLGEKLLPSDKKMFPLLFTQYSKHELMSICYKGCKKYFLKEKKSLRERKEKYRRFWNLNRIISYFFLTLLCWFFVNRMIWAFEVFLVFK